MSGILTEMDATTLTYLFVGASFALYIGIAIWSRAASTREFYVAGGHVHPIANGMATPADWMPGDPVIVPPAGSCGVAKDRMEGKDKGVTCHDWFFCTKELPV